MDDRQIIELYFSRDQGAIAETDKKYGRLCYGVAYNLLESAEDSEECLNDTYLAAWNKMPPERPDALSAFLVRITRNISIGIFRAKRAKKRYSGFETVLSELDDCVPDSRNTEAEAEGRELSRIIDAWLKELSDSDCALFIRRYFYGEDIGELAELAETTNSRISQRLFALRKRLKNRLEKEGICL